MSRFGVIDLGTNTFHILIVENVDNSGFKEIYRERRFVKLAEEGIENIGVAPFERALSAMIDYAKILKENNVENYRAIGTAALREAKNGQVFISQVLEKTGLEVGLISGEEEARLIHLGVQLVVEPNDGIDLIMDIGGGSVEFIFYNKNGVISANSFPVGVAILFKKFHNHEPILTTEIEAAEAYLKTILKPLESAFSKYSNIRLVGASGAFEVVENILVKEKNGLSAVASVAEFLTLHQQVLHSNLEDRLNMEGIPSTRADLIVVAFILINFVIQNADIQEIVVCDYALKEGVLFEMIQDGKNNF
jgi:exopolyphosphatase/guanosine-5'-triphosphate,3'-diphosphate pyrophosphatase